MTPRDTVEAYYAALRAGEPLAPFFADGDDVVKVGISERLVGHDAVARGLHEQTRTTTDWSVESRDLRVRRLDDGAATYADVVDLAWTATETGARRSFETRWSGALEREGADWAFAGLHVSAPRALDDG